MHVRTLSGLALALAVALPNFAMAQPGHRDDDHDHGHPPPAHGPARHGPPPPRDEHPDWRGAGPQHEFRQGGRLTGEYANRQYVVDDWRSHHLDAPPRGYHWVQTGSDYVLAAVATGIIAQVILSQQ